MTEDPVDALPGLGPKSRALLAQVGIRSAAQLKAADVYDVYLRLKALDPRTSLNMLYGLMAAQEGRDWRVIARERRTEILLRLDELGLAPK